MKFSAVPEANLTGINLLLPPEPFINTLVLSGHRAAGPKVYVGSAHWGHASWVGPVYPAKTPATQYRNLYPQYFNTAELNATHYNIYEPEVIKKWAAPAKGKDFKFCPKFPQQISHYSNFKNTQPATIAFLESIQAFEENLGPSFLQLSETFSPAGKEALYTYLASLPHDFLFFLEVRHPDWFKDEKVSENLFTNLRKLNVGAVITDGPGRRDVVHMNLTVPKLFLRFVCNSTHPTSYKRIDDWIVQLAKWIANGMDEVYIMLHPGDEASIPELSLYWINGLNKACQLNIKPPMPLQPQLF